MEAIICQRCGSSDFIKEKGILVCKYCRTEYVKDDKPETVIEINEDVKRLLEKCKKEPQKARKYANLILDIDPMNEEAKKYL